MNCKYCDKNYENSKHLRQHEIRCKFNPDKIEIKNNLIEYNKKIKNGEIIINNNTNDDKLYCKFCEKKCKNLNSLKQHEIRCKLNPDKIECKFNKSNNTFSEYNKKVKSGEIKGSNQYVKAKRLGLEKPIMSDETRKKISEAGKKQKKWDAEKRKRHSLSMLKAVNEHPESYSANNVSGRTKSYRCVDSLNNDVKVKGSWELLVAEHLNELNIKWTNKIDETLLYYWDNSERRYFPDFYLIDYNLYVEVKGYQRDRDLEKWKTISNRLIIIKKYEINKIKKNIFNLFEIISQKNLVD